MVACVRADDKLFEHFIRKTVVNTLPSRDRAEDADNIAPDPALYLDSLFHREEVSHKSCYKQ